MFRFIVHGLAVLALALLAACAVPPRVSSERPAAHRSRARPGWPQAGMPAPEILAPLAAGGRWPPRAIALLLPLTGAYAEAAESVRDGVLAGYYALPAPRPALRLYDTGGGPEGALAAYRQAQTDAADLALGPLTREAVDALAAEPALPLPLLALNRPVSPLPPGHASFALTPEDEAAAVADRMLRYGQRRILAVAAGGDATAQRVLEAFAARLREGGGEVREVATVVPGSADFGAVLAQSFARLGAEGHDAVFVALRAPEARLLIPQLAVAGFEPRPLLATSQILIGGGNARLDRELDGIEFTDLAWRLNPPPGLPEAERTAAALPSARGGGARLFAFGLDAIGLIGRLPALLADPEAGMDGATGRLRLDLFGNVVRTPAWAVFRGGRPQPAGEGGLRLESVPADGGT